MKKEKLSGPDGFEIYYSSMFGERWPILKASLLKESKAVAYDKNLTKTYYLDYASVQAAMALPSLEDGCCLDMCAAPGGKTLVLLNKMGGEIQANEISAERRNRLIRVLDEHVQEKDRNRIKVSSYDAARMPRYGHGVYERILLDAPCSSERHVLQNEKYLKQWTEARIKNLVQRQWALLSAAFLLLKPAGFLVYSTCALSDAENDNLIERLLSKYKDKVETVLIPQDSFVPIAPEKTKYGYRFLPDLADGSGPIYFSLIKKK